MVSIQEIGKHVENPLLDFYVNIIKHTFYLRNKSWKPECVGSFNMDLTGPRRTSREWLCG